MRSPCRSLIALPLAGLLALQGPIVGHALAADEDESLPEGYEASAWVDEDAAAEPESEGNDEEGFDLSEIDFSDLEGGETPALDIDLATLKQVSVPSGREMRLLEFIADQQGPDGATARFRFVAPALAEADDPSEDMQALCNSVGLETIRGMVPTPNQVVISLADRALPFGQAAPDAVQFFEAYRIEDAACIWELF